jgi:FtsZ-binding cell division protein ZapB
LNAEDPKKLFLKDEKIVYKNDPKKEKEMLKQENERLKEENNKISVESSRIRSRKEVLEKEIKYQKEDFTNKIKILLEKSDNDEKLITVLNREMERLRLNGTGKPGSSNNNSGGGYNYNESPVFNLQQENAKLRKDLREKEVFINNLNSSLVNEGLGDNQISSLSGLVNKLKALEDENKALKQGDDNGKIYEQIVKDNTKLRLKIRDLEEKLNK